MPLMVHTFITPHRNCLSHMISKTVMEGDNKRRPVHIGQGVHHFIQIEARSDKKIAIVDKLV